MVIKFCKDVIQGAGNLPGMGEHPGTVILIGFILMGGIAGLKGGILGFVIGSLVMAVFMLPIWIIGCRDRARLYQRSLENAK